MHLLVQFLQLIGGEFLDLLARWDELEPTDIKDIQSNFDDLFMLAEMAVASGRDDVYSMVESELSAAEIATIELVKARLRGGDLESSVEAALEIATTPESRDLTLEGRLRMERGLVRFESGDIDGAKEDLTWAETRLGSVAKASRLHDISLLNKAALYMSCGEGIMALETYGRISRHGGHANETIAISRMGAARIHAALGHRFDAVRNAWNAHAYSLLAQNRRLAIESGAIFIDLASIHQKEGAVLMREQVENAGPRNIDDPEPLLEVNPSDVGGVFEWCIENLDEGVSGENRVDLRAMLQLAHRLDRMEDVSFVIEQRDDIDDEILITMLDSLSEEE